MIRVQETKSFHGPDSNFESGQVDSTYLNGGSGVVTFLSATLSLKERLISSGRASPEDKAGFGRTKGATASPRLDEPV